MDTQRSAWALHVGDAQASASGMICIAPDGRLEHVDNGIRELLGIPVTSILDAHWIGFLHPDDTHGAFEEWKRRSSAGLAFEYYCRFWCRASHYCWCHLALEPRFDADGVPLTFVGYLANAAAAHVDVSRDSASTTIVPRRILDRSKPRSRNGSPSSERLSARECAVLGLVAKGLSNKRAAQTLKIAPETVKSHLKRAFAKLHSKTRAEAVARAFETGFLTHASTSPFDAHTRSGTEIPAAPRVISMFPVAHRA